MVGMCRESCGISFRRIGWNMENVWTGKRGENPIYAKNHSDAVEVYDRVTLEFDRFLAEHGYVREGSSYRVERECTETVTFFCHFGITCALLSHLWNMSPFSAWQYFAFAPTSVTEIVTEEREKGIACFRGLKLGDASHLYAGNEPVSVAARFCEVYSDMNSRH